MRSKFFILLLLFLSACNKHFVATQYHYEEQKLATTMPVDSVMLREIKPYKDSLDKEMNVVLAVADDALVRSQPESDLGNWMCDMILKESRNYFKQDIDFTFLNHGGIRLPGLPKGDITLGKLIELMPFENFIALMKLKGTTIDTLFNYMASKGGWHVSGARYKIKDGKAIDITINGATLDLNKVYTVAVSEYLAQGGDNCTMLKGLPFTRVKKSLRDALIDGAKEATAKGEHIKSVMDGRIQTAQ